MTNEKHGDIIETVNDQQSFLGGIVLASEAVKKILEAEAESEKKNTEARKRRDEIINDASGKSSLAVQKRISEASSETARLKKELEKKAAVYRKKAEETCDAQISDIRSAAEKNMDKAIDAVIAQFF